MSIFKTRKDRGKLADYEKARASLHDAHRSLQAFNITGDSLDETILSMLRRLRGQAQTIQIQDDELRLAYAELKHPMRNRPRDAKGHFLPVNGSAHP